MQIAHAFRTVRLPASASTVLEAYGVVHRCSGTASTDAVGSAFVRTFEGQVAQR
jgi:hypothetical protein